MLDNAVELGIHYPAACHQQGAYKHRFDQALFPQTREICRTTLSLPMGPMMTHEQQDRVVTLIKQWLQV